MHGLIGISEEDICQNDIAAVRRAGSDLVPGIVKDEVTVTFKDKKVRDLVMVSAANLSR